MDSLNFDMAPLSLATIALFILNLLLLGLLLRTLFALYREAKGRRQHRYERRCSHFSLKPIAPTDIIFLGDSITEGGEWRALFPNHSVRNFGIGSDTTAGLLARLEPIIEGQPLAIFLLIGTNDIGFGIPQAETVANYRAIVEQICSRTPETALFIQSIFPRKADEYEAVEQLNQHLRSISAEYQAHYVDLYPKFTGGNRGIDSSYTNDNLHLMGRGYRQWQSVLQPHIEGSHIQGGVS